MGYYQFKPEDAYKFARTINIQARERRNELWFKSCPFCHGTGKGNEKTFSINLETGQFCCFRESCKRQGNMLDLAREFDFSLGEQVDEYYNPKRVFRKLKAPKEPIVPKEPAIQFLEGRGISKSTAEKYQITCQTDHKNIICFPFIDENGIWQLVKYRKADYDPEKDSGKEWCEKDCKPILFGMYQCDMSIDTLIITEGMMDSLSVIEAGIPNAVSVPTGANGFTWVPYCWNWVNRFKRIIVFGDYEKGHITLLDDIKKRFKSEIYHVREEDYLDCKDANALLQKYGKEQVRKCIENAIRVPLPYVIDIADIEDIDIYEVEKLETGISSLDYPLYGGFPFPSVVLITGKRGEGKSTLTSEIIANAIEQGYTSLVYSGELAAPYFRAGLVKQLAGNRHTFKYVGKHGEVGYKVSDSNTQIIKRWMRGKLHVIDNSQVGSNDTIGLLDAVENVIQQYGVRVILLDNLMTALSSMAEKSSEKYELQGQFTRKLTQIAMRYNVLIILVAHKRKNSFAGDEMDDVMGASDITNLASIVISYGRGGKNDNCDDSQRMIRLLKNRLFGKVNFSGWIMDYDERSSRIYGPNDNPDKEYSWVKLLSDDFEDITEGELEELPWT